MVPSLCRVFAELPSPDLDFMEALLRNRLTLLVVGLLAITAVIGNSISVFAQAAPAPAHKAPAAAASVDIPIPDIKYTKFVLANGLTVLVHEDHKAPIVAVNTWYHVGRRMRSRGRRDSPICSST